MALDRTTGWCRSSIKGYDLYLPEQFVARFNSIKSVNAEFLNHECSNRLMFRNWDDVLHRHFVPIPTIKDGGYTSFYFFEFKNGILSMRKTAESEIEYTHAYLQTKVGSNDSTSYEELVNRCKSSLEKALFVDEKTFDNATIEHINVLFKSGLCRHPSNTLTETKIESFWTKGFSIPKEYIGYYPTYPTELGDGNQINAVEKKRKLMDESTMKMVKKLKKAVVPAATVSGKSIASYFASASKVEANAALPAPKKTATKLTLDWHHNQEEKIDESAFGHPQFYWRTPHHY